MSDLIAEITKSLNIVEPNKREENELRIRIVECASAIAQARYAQLGQSGLQKVLQDMVDFARLQGAVRQDPAADGKEEDKGATQVATIEDQAKEQIELEEELLSPNLPSAEPMPTPGKIYSNFKLPTYPVPRAIYEAIERKKQNKLITSKLKTDTYSLFFKTLLFIEEAYRVMNMRQYDLREASVEEHEGGLFRLDVPGLAEGRPSVMQGDFMLMKCKTKPLSCKGYIYTVREKDVIIKLPNKFSPSELTGLKFHVSFFTSRTPIRRCHHAVEQYVENKALNLPRILFPTAAESFQEPRFQTGADNHKMKFFTKQLNHYQKRAIINILEHVARPSPYLIWGPPGTGKTLTLCEAIMQVYSRTESIKILACGNSNTSADIIASKLKKTRKVATDELVRVSAFYRMDGQIPNDIKSLTKSMEQISAEMYKEYRIVVTTCIQAGALNNFVDKFDYVFIDEAGHATEPESLIPICLLKPGGSVVMAGDFKQLGPVCYSKYKVSTALGISMFERLSQLSPYERKENDGKLAYDCRYLTMLLKSYRSVERIMTVNNELFYNNELQFPMEMPKRFDSILGFNWPVVCHHVKGNEAQDKFSPSWFNYEEVLECVSYVTKLYRAGVKPQELGIISPYRRQIDKLQGLMESQKLKLCKIGTVEEFQGDEREVIIISTVRACPSRIAQDIRLKLGFLYESARFNVATSRSKWLTIVVGDSTVLKRDLAWKKYIEKSQKICMGERFDQAMEAKNKQD